MHVDRVSIERPGVTPALRSSRTQSCIFTRARKPQVAAPQRRRARRAQERLPSDTFFFKKTTTGTNHVACERDEALCSRDGGRGTASGAG
jgi:hypothetical protein